MFMINGGVATGVGSLPGVEIREALAETFGELPELPYLPELPARGAGADMIGRGAALLTDLAVEIYAGRWRVAARAGKDLRRAHDIWLRDLDALTEQADGYVGPLKLQAAGPWTLAASLELPIGGALLADHGAVRDLAASLADGLRSHVEDVRKRVPGASVLLQLDEPSLPAVLKGRVPTDSGLHTYRSVPVATAREVLESVVQAVGVPTIAHCCAPDVPVSLLQEAGFAAVALDLSLVERLDPLGELLDAGRVLFAGMAKPTMEQVSDLLRKLGFESKVDQIVITPACGLASSTPEQAREVLKAAREAARRLVS